MSTQGQIFDFMRTLKPEGEKGYVPATASQIALQTGFDRDKVNKTIFNLSHTGKIEVVRGPNGRDIVGYRVLDYTSPTRQERTPQRSRPAPVVVHGAKPGRPARVSLTPNLDAYAAAKERFAAMQDDLGDLVVASFNENVYAEEGLRIKARLESMEQQFIEQRRELDEATRDLRFLRGKHRVELAEGVAKTQAGD